MDLFVLTYGRATPERQHTLRQLNAAGLRACLVIQAREAGEYLWYSSGDIAVLPPDITTIAPSRQYIHEFLASEKYVMLDDDLHFFKRRKDDKTKFITIFPDELVQMFDDIEHTLDEYPHVGIASREGGNRITSSITFNTRIMRLLAYKRSAVLGRFSDMEVMEDFHVALSMLQAGRQNVLLNNYCHNQAEGSNAAGGCSHFRTPELQARNAHRLADIHKPFVTVIEKKTKTAWGGGKRTDVRIQWKAAYESSRTSRLDNGKGATASTQGGIEAAPAVDVE